ncbi:hypothetical protein TcasGA2_TC034793 [Tribolium castaneum]|uniref:Uncharacterized protein n=1 Tax=Tribolium castaneum TaxID=7070 RepID=A0A139WEE7_TRICA|nr:hypothetical protein TcasGA2_TC034793 [Tribolium castaneum]
MLSYAVIYIAVFIFTCERYNAMDNQPLQSFGDHFFQQIVDSDNVKEPQFGPQRESDVLEERERVGKEENKENCPLKQKYSPCSSYEIKRNRRPFTKRELDEIGSLFVNHLFESDHEFSDTKEDFKTNTNTDMYDFKFKKAAVYGKFKQDNRGNRTKICDEEFVQSPSRHHKETLNGFVTMPFYKHNSCKTVQKNKNERCIAVNLYPENKIPQQYDYIAFLSDDDKFVNVPALRFNVFSERNRRTDNFSPFFVSTYKKGSHRLHDLEKLKCQHCTYVPILADLLIENIKTSLKMQTHDAETPKFVDGAVLVNSRFKQKKDIGKDLHSTFTYQNQKQGHAMQNFPFKNLVDSVKLRHDKMVKKEISTDLSKLANASVNNKQNTEESGSAPPKQSDDLLTSFRFSNETFKDLEEIPNENFTSTVVTQITAQKTTETLSFPTKIEETNAPEESKAVPVEENNLSEAFQFPNLKTFQKIKSAFKNWMSPGSESTSVGAKYLKDTTIIASTTSVVSETSSETISSLTTSEMQSSISEVTEILPSLSTFTTSSKSAETKQSVKLTSLAQLLIPTHVTYTSSSYQPNAYQEKKPQMDHPYGTPPNYGTNEYQANNPQMDHPYGTPPNYGTNKYQENNPQKYHPNAPSPNGYQEYNPQIYPPYYQVPTYSPNGYQENNPYGYRPYDEKTKEYQKNNPPNKDQRNKHPISTFRTNTDEKNKPKEHNPYGPISTYGTSEYETNIPTVKSPNFQTNIKDNSLKVTPAPDRYGPSTYRSENFKEGSSNEFGNYRDDDLSGILDLLGHDLDSDNIHTSDTREQGILEKIKSKLRILSKDLKLMMVIQNLLSKSKERSKKRIRRIKKFVPFSTRLRSKRRKITASRNEKVKKGKRLRHVLQRRKRRLVKKRKKDKT